MEKKLPQLKDWESTRDALHEALQPLRTAVVLGRGLMSNQLEYSLLSAPYGATTGRLDFGGELRLDYNKLVVEYAKDSDVLFSVPLSGHTQRSLFDAVFDEFKKLKLLTDPESQRDISHHREDKISGTEKLEADFQKSEEYAEAQWRVSSAMSAFRSKLSGEKTPVVLWPHGFDLSFIWFKSGFDEKKDPHMHFGFSPGFEDARPYLYFYAWPVPDGLIGSELPRNGKWIEQWSTPGGSFSYDEFVKDTDPEESISETLLEVFDKASRMMDKS